MFLSTRDSAAFAASLPTLSLSVLLLVVLCECISPLSRSLPLRETVRGVRVERLSSPTPLEAASPRPITPIVLANPPTMPRLLADCRSSLPPQPEIPPPLEADRARVDPSGCPITPPLSLSRSAPTSLPFSLSPSLPKDLGVCVRGVCVCADNPVSPQSPLLCDSLFPESALLIL